VADLNSKVIVAVTVPLVVSGLLTTALGEPVVRTGSVTTTFPAVNPSTTPVPVAVMAAAILLPVRVTFRVWV
jgi:hypothetical protein